MSEPATFQFATATRIVFGAGSSQQLPKLAAPFGDAALIVTGSEPARHRTLIELLTAGGINLVPFTVSGEPTVRRIEEGVTLARKERRQFVIGLGGGSAIDAGKAIAALMTNPGQPLDYLEVIGRGQALEAAPAPFIAIPTTSGTGAEVTKNAVLSSEEHRVKVSLRSDLMLPKLALVDSTLTHSVPQDVTAATGLDALTQVLEPFVSCLANPLTDALAREGIRRAAVALPRVYEDGTDTAARQDMALVSLLGGLALANAKLGAAHGFAGPIGGMFDAPHGAVCARLLPFCMEANVAALSETPEHPSLAKFTEAAQLLTGRSSATAAEGIRWLQRLCEQLRVPPLGNYGMTDSDVPTIVEKAERASSMKGNPVRLSTDKLTNILKQAL